METVILDVKIMKFDRCLGTSNAEMPPKFQNDVTNLNPYLVVGDFTRSYNKTSYRSANGSSDPEVVQQLSAPRRND